MLILLIVMTGLMGGIYFTFSVFVMKALNQLPPLQAGEAMNKINDVIINTLFLPVFFISTLWHAGLIVWCFADWKNPQSTIMITAALLYIVGMFGVTVFGNVPLNNKLKFSIDKKDEQSLIQSWKEYYQPWARLNHLRMTSCIFSCALLTLAISY